MYRKEVKTAVSWCFILRVCGLEDFFFSRSKDKVDT